MIGMAKKRGNNEGSIYRRKNGTWAAQYTVWTVEGRKRRSVSGKTRAEVSRKLTEAMADRDGGLLYDVGKLTICEYLDRWLADSVKGTVKESTYANYVYIIHKHISPALWHVKLKTLTPSHVRAFYGEKTRTNLSAATVKKMHVVLRKALSQAVSDGLIPGNAADGAKPPRTSAPGEEIKPLDSEECVSFLEATRGERLEALYVVANHCGLREGELLALRWEDVYLDALRPAVSVPSNLRNRSFKRIKTRANVREDLRFHDLRHTCATLLFSEGVNAKVVSELLGHASITITLNAYAHVLPDMQDSAADAMEAALS
jgi:integrase